MIGRKALLACVLMALVLDAMGGGVILTYWPRHGWAFEFAHWPVRVRNYLAYWLVLPLIFTTLVAAVGASTFIFRRRAVTENQRRWIDTTGVAIGLVSIAIQTIRLVGLILARAERSAFVAAGGDPHAFHFDPQFIVMRLGMAVGALFIVWIGNRLPKLTTGRPGRPDRNAVTYRICGWMFVFTGLACLTVSIFVQPFGRAVLVDGVIGVGSLVVWIAINVINFQPPTGRPPCDADSPDVRFP
jgi:hypothetical protein